MKLSVKNMVCNRCIMVVKAEFEAFGLHPDTVSLGEVVLNRELDKAEKALLNIKLRNQGFELIDDRKSRLIENIKTAILELVHYSDTPLRITMSDYLSERFHQEYSSLSKLFSEVQGTTIEQYLITQKIERVKELLVYDEHSLGEIAFLLNYSSASHLSKQFKKVTGMTPSHFKQVKEKKRIPLDEV